MPIASHSSPQQCRFTLQETEAKIPPPVPGQQLLKKGRIQNKKKFVIQVEVPPSFTLEKKLLGSYFQEPVYLSARFVAGNSCSVNHLQEDHRSKRLVLSSASDEQHLEYTKMIINSSL